MDDTHTILKKIHSQELNLVHDDIKWMTEVEVVMEAPLEGSVIAGEEETSVGRKSTSIP